MCSPCPCCSNGFLEAVGPALWNNSRGTNTRCIADTPPADAWKCSFAPHVYPRYTAPSGVPFFVTQSMADAWQTRSVLGLPCDPGSCNANFTADFLAFQATLQVRARGRGRCGFYYAKCVDFCDLVKVAIVLTCPMPCLPSHFQSPQANVTAANKAAPGTDGLYLTGCYQHGQTCSDGDFFAQSEGGQSQSKTLYSWMYPESGGTTSEAGQPWPAAQSCYTGAHGWC